MVYQAVAVGVEVVAAVVENVDIGADVIDAAAGN